MAIIVDKVQKRKDIALACKEMFFKHGIKDVTISQLAKTAGVGKGTIYEYFKNKEDIVFEIVNVMIQKRNELVHVQMSSIETTKEKVKLFASFFYADDDIELRQLYKEFISIALSSPDEKMIEFQTKCFMEYYIWFEQILQEGIDKGEIIQEAMPLAKGMFVTSEGLFISHSATNAIANLQNEIDSYIDAIFQVIEVKK